MLFLLRSSDILILDEVEQEGDGGCFWPALRQMESADEEK